MSGYDQKLLEGAGEISKEARQAGYNVDILNPPAPPRSPVQPNPHNSTDGFSSGSPIPPPGAAAPAIVGGTSGPGSYSNKGMEGFAEESNPYPKKTPFYRTRKGIIMIVAAVIIVIAIAVGVGAGVGASKGGKSNGLDSAHSTTTNGGSNGFTVPSVSAGSTSTENIGNPLGGSTTTRQGVQTSAAPATTSATDGTNIGGIGHP